MVLLAATLCGVLAVAPDAPTVDNARTDPPASEVPPVDAPPSTGGLELPSKTPSGTTLLNPNLPEKTESKRSARLREIDHELDDLTQRPSPVAAFGNAFEKLLPFWAVASAPVIILGYLEVNSSGSDSDHSNVIGIALGISVAALAVMLAYCFTVAVGTWMEDVPKSVDREQKIDRLMRERQRLLELPPDS